MEEHGVYDIQPRSGAIPPGDFLHVAGPGMSGPNCRVLFIRDVFIGVG